MRLLPTHVLAVVVGAARPDGDAYFGSLPGFGDHLALAQKLGLVRSPPESVDDAPEVLLTDTGRAFFERFQLADCQRAARTTGTCAMRR
ncbi:hypothetical protein AB0E55_22885 [Amycolatopsis keratiniphila]|uniref:hypothetical protein n=1 Tax=Amycolatopsis keratiniphila TaxID=129921 RepID=UPI0033C9D8EE